MLGLAKDLFKQGAVSIDDFMVEIKSEQPWPSLQALLGAGYFSFIDYSFAKAVLAPLRIVKEEIALCLSYLMMISRAGHVCLTVDKGILSPSIKSFSSLELINLSSIEEKILSGFAQLPSSLFQEEGKGEFKPLVRSGGRYYLQKQFLYETEILSHFQRLAFSPHQEPLIPYTNAELNPQQCMAVQSVLSKPLTILSGGPGTGKTYTASCAIEAFLNKSSSMRVLVGAPTGKAVAQLSAKMKKTAEGHRVEAGTLHALLGIKRAEDLALRSKKLFADLIVIDESSMIDLGMFAALLAAIPTGTHLLLMGDHHQLSPVEGGAVFADLCAFAATHLPGSFSELKTSHRCEVPELLELSQEVRSGDFSDVMITLKGKRSEALQFASLPQSGRLDDVHYPIWEAIARGFPSPTNEEPTPESLFASANRLRLLSPVRKGAFGVDELNQAIWERGLRQLKSNRYWAVPILITKTSYQLDLCNGELGYIIRSIGEKQSHRDYALFVDKTGQGYRKIPVSILPPFENAYALSVHKSQGSEFDQVLLFLPEGAGHFGRELLYTGITRSRSHLAIFGGVQTIERALEVSSQKHSGLVDRLKNFL